MTLNAPKPKPRVWKPKQNKKTPRPIIIKFVRYSCRRRLFFNKKNLKSIGISITESLTSKCMQMFNKATERFVFKNVRTLDGRIYYLAEGSTKPQVFRNWTEVACLELWEKYVAWIPFLCFYSHCSFFLGEIIFVNNFSQVSLLFCFYTTVLHL